MKLKEFILSVSVLLISGCSGSISGLQVEISDLLSDFPGDVGVAVAFGKDTVLINADVHFPMFSVVKFPQALAVAGRAHLDENIEVTEEDLNPDTWSPMRDDFPEGGTFSVGQILEYALKDSDNNASDILFSRFAGPDVVELSLKSRGINDCRIRWTEADQHEDPGRCYDNWMTPVAAIQLLGRFYGEYSTDDFLRFIWNTMAECNTGNGRIPKYISDGAEAIVHKTGTGFVLEDGTVTGINDIGCICLPDGSHFNLAVFIKDAKCGPAECEELIASIARACYNRFAQR